MLMPNDENVSYNPICLLRYYKSPEFQKQFSCTCRLGAEYRAKSTDFRIWAPVAESVSLCLYSDGTRGAAFAVHAMERVGGGVWQIKLPGDLAGTYYTYKITNFGETAETVDIYARAVGLNGVRGMVVDLNGTNPPGWENDSFERVVQPTDAVVWETHVGDFSNDPLCGVRREWRGKYLAFTESGTTLPDGQTPTCVNYLSRLGVNYVQLLPVYDYGSIDESKPNEFNWGYDPLNFNAPEGSFSTNPADGACRIREFKAMVAALHKAGIGVVMDVVYNHTFKTQDSWFHRTVPYYYHRTLPDGKFADGSACGNETASEHVMCRRFIVDSVLYWAKEYHIDGFRFDLMGLLDVETMNLIRSKLDELPGGKRILVYGEPWGASPPALPDGFFPADKKHVRLLNDRIGVFSDATRDCIKGDVFKRREKGFVCGAKGLENKVKSSLQGWSEDGFCKPFAKTPSQVVSYLSAHDNLTLWDKLVASTKGGRCYTNYDETIVKMNKICAVLYIMARGTLFMQSGEEFARTKRGMENSYCAAPFRNRINWKRLTPFTGLNEYYRGLLQIRAAFPPLRSVSAESGMVFSDIPDGGAVAFTLRDEDCVLAVCVNARISQTEIVLKAKPGETLPEKWEILADPQRAGTQPLGTVCGICVSLPGQTALILKGSTNDYC